MTIEHIEVNEFKKIIKGFVIQKFRKDDNNKFTCVEQEFIAGDCQYENLKETSFDNLPHEHQPFNMTLVSKDQITGCLCELLTSIDTGGEQSRQFEKEIKLIEELMQDLGWTSQD